MADLIQDQNSFYVDLCACARGLGRVRVCVDPVYNTVRAV